MLYVRCSGSGDKALGGTAADGSWSPRVAAVMRTSLEGAPCTRSPGCFIARPYMLHSGLGGS